MLQEMDSATAFPSCVQLSKASFEHHAFQALSPLSNLFFFFFLDTQTKLNSILIVSQYVKINSTSRILYKMCTDGIFSPGFTFFDQKNPFLKGFLLPLNLQSVQFSQNAGPIGTEMVSPKMSVKVLLLVVPSIFCECSIQQIWDLEKNLKIIFLHLRNKRVTLSIRSKNRCLVILTNILKQTSRYIPNMFH